MFIDIKLKERFQERFEIILEEHYDKEVEDATAGEKFFAAARVCRSLMKPLWKEKRKYVKNNRMKVGHCFTPETLLGRQLSNNLLNLGVKEEMREALKSLGIDLNYLEDQEEELPLGNGGLGRLSACELEGFTTKGYPVYQHCLKYGEGFFKQEIKNGEQIELPDISEKDGKPNPFGVQMQYSKKIVFGNDVNGNREEVEVVPFDIPIVGSKEHGQSFFNTLRLWVTPKRPELVKNLYPSDKDDEGKILRIKHEYILVSAALQQIVEEFKEQYHDFSLLPKKVWLHINDTYPAVAIPELMRILMEQKKPDGNNISWDEAWEITKKCCSYTNHTIMGESLPKWPISLYEWVLPDIYKIIDEIHHKFEEEIETRYPDQKAEKVKSMAILYDGEVRMAHLAIAGSFSVNGVSKHHTKILKTKILKDFYEMTPEKFRNITNGVSYRRFLIYANEPLSKWIDQYLNDGRWRWKLELLKGLEKVAEDLKAQKDIENAKLVNKKMLKDYIKETKGIEVDENAIFNIQVKRIHEYKRQLMNVLGIRWLCDWLREDENALKACQPMVCIFAGKAHPEYPDAKRIIKEIHNLEKDINDDKKLQGKIKVVFLKNFNVTLGEKVYTACDVSEQISTAGTEASGTGNMKFMMNGAITLGTMDGANVEIAEAVGTENMILFGMEADEIEELKKSGNYRPRDIYESHPYIQKAVNSLESESLKNRLLEEDPYFVLKDLEAYKDAVWKANQLYKDRTTWNKMAILNVANSGIFSIDRNVKEYAEMAQLEDYYTLE